ncbi:hypothetical protein [Marinimicrobium agarilyticum]|uniref:hypothetical protein n=1 Tax=Marinimicrobium agarilyticum TaxID=306546 RepID=UPI000414D39C|nr:hypothetical protein [Marinimicrobium agarilyticum]
MLDVKTLVGLVLAAFASASFGCEIEKLYSQKLDFNQVATTLKSSDTAPVVLVEEGVGSYWLINPGSGEGEGDVSITPVDLKGESGRVFEHSQWRGARVAFFSPEETIVYDVKENAVVSRLGVDQSGRSDYHYWLGQGRGRISGTELLDGKSADEIEPEEPPHTPQTALAVAEKEGVYFTAGYHDQTVKKWSLDTGRLLDSWTLGRWYSSRKITDLRLVGDQLLAASSRGKVEALSTGDATVEWSASLCEDAPYFLPVGIGGQAEGGVFYRCEGEPAYGYLHKEGGSWVHTPMHSATGVSAVLVAAVSLPDEEKAIFAFENGLVAAVDRQTGQLEQELSPALSENIPSLIAYNAAQRQIFVVSEGDTLSVYRLGSDK